MRRRTVVLAALAAGGLVLLTAGRTWVTATGLSGGIASEATTSGGAAAPVATAMALVVMAGALALTTARRLGAVDDRLALDERQLGRRLRLAPRRR